MEAMTISVRLFAVLRERAGRERVELELADGATVDDAVAALGKQAGLDGLLEALPVAMAVNREYASGATELRPGDELALIPPVSGGAVEVHARISAEPLSLERVAALVVRPGAGAVVTFEGVTRAVERLEYEAYAEMAEERIGAILADCCKRHRLEALSEPSVIVAVAAAHREEAFAGAREAIDRIKAEAPIWKREVSEGESRWVEGTTPA